MEAYYQAAFGRVNPFGRTQLSIGEYSLVTKHTYAQKATYDHLIILYRPFNRTVGLIGR